MKNDVATLRVNDKLCSEECSSVLLNERTKTVPDENAFLSCITDQQGAQRNQDRDTLDIEERMNAFDNKVFDTRVAVQQSSNGDSVKNHIGIIAHEINNPLDAVIRYVNLASHSLNGEHGSRSIEFLHEAGKGLRRITKIIKSLLHLSQCFSQNVQTIDINREIEESCDMLDNYIKLRHVDIAYCLNPQLPVVADFGLRLAFNNLITNACNAMEEGGTLTITSVRKPTIARIIFNDTGSGLPPELLDKIFDPFFTTKKIGEGSGLGLAITYEIIQKYHGAISVSSTCGQGTTFIIDIPIT